MMEEECEEEELLEDIKGKGRKETKKRGVERNFKKGKKQLRL